MSDQKNEIVLIGVHREAEGKQQVVVLTDANGVEHTAKTAQALWDAMAAILDDESVPRTEVPASNVAEVQGIVAIAQEQAQEFITGRYGPVIGGLAGTIARNGVKKLVTVMQRNSR